MSRATRSARVVFQLAGLGSLVLSRDALGAGYGEPPRSPPSYVHEMDALQHAVVIGAYGIAVLPVGFTEIDRGGGVKSSVAGPGYGVGLDLGYRLSPSVQIGPRAQLERLDAADALGSDTSARAASLELGAAVHLAPYRSMDPSVSAAAGYRRVEVEAAGEKAVWQGVRLVRLELGIDLRPTERFMLGCFVNGALDHLPSSDGAAAIAGEGNTVGSAGVVGLLGAGIRLSYGVGGRVAPRRPAPENLTARR